VPRDPLIHGVQYDLVNIAPAPTLTGLEGVHDGMAGAMEMFGGVYRETGRNSRRGRTPGISEGESSNSPSLSTLHSLRECEGIRVESGPNGNSLT
jgi:hypothetical protein